MNNEPIVHYPASFEKDFVGDLFGYYHADSNEYNVLENEAKQDNVIFLGRISTEDIDFQENSDIPLLKGQKKDNELVFFQNGKTCKMKPYDLKSTVFSRNTGILETEVMSEKSAIISGCGSVGSLVALELARAGVGRFLLIDNDTFDYHNICRHQCGVHDVGKFKVNAVKERILQINPNAQVATEPVVIERVFKTVFDNFIDAETIIIGCADNREGDLYADNTITKSYNIPLVSIGFWERAFAGEIFYSIPKKTAGYEKIYNSGMSSRVSTNRRLYTFEEDLQNVNFEPGISVDIAFVTVVGIKLIIDLLNRNNANYIPKVINDLTQFTLVCNTNDPKIGGVKAEIFAHPLQITRSIHIA